MDEIKIKTMDIELPKWDLSEIYEWFKENIKKYGSIIIETTGIEKLSNKIRNLV